MKSIILLFVATLFSQAVLASGPMEITVRSTGSGFGIEETEEAMQVARQWAAERAAYISEDELNEYDEDGYIPVGPDARSCYLEDIVKSSSECSSQSDGKIRCDYEAEFKCSQSVWHESQ